MLHPMLSIAIFLSCSFITLLPRKLSSSDKPRQTIRGIMEAAYLNIMEFDISGLIEVLLSQFYIFDAMLVEFWL